MSELLTPSQAAERMGVTVRTVYQYLSDGDLEGAYKDERGRWQIPESALEAHAALNADAPVEPVQAAPPPPDYELTPEERAARRERQRAAALAALYAPDENDAMDEPIPDAPAPEAAADAEADAALGDEGPAAAEPVAAPAAGQDAPAEAMEETTIEDASLAEGSVDEEVVETEVVSEEIGSEEIVDVAADDVAGEDMTPEEAALGAAAVAPLADAPTADTSAAADEAEAHVQADPSVDTDDYVMDSKPVKEEPDVEEPAATKGDAGDVEPAVARAVVVEGSGAELSDVNLNDVDLAKLSADDEPDAAAVAAKKSGIGCPVMLAILASLLILLAAAFFIANQTLGLFGGADDDVAVVEPGRVETVAGDNADAVADSAAEPATEAATDTAAPAEQAAAAGAPIQPAAEGESLVVIPAFAGADGAVSAQLRDTITQQAAALGVANLRAEVEPAALSAGQIAEAVDLATQLQADTVLWGEAAGDQTVVNLLNLGDAGLPAAEASAVIGDRIQPIEPSGSLSFTVDDVSAQAAFLAGMAVGQSLLASGDYAGAAAAIQQAVDSVGPGAPPAGLEEAFNRLGWIHQTQQQDPQAALDAYTLALQLNPDDAVALNNIGLANDVLGDKQQALFFYNRALPLLRDAQNPSAEALVLNRIGALYNEIGDVQQALTFYNRALPLTMEAGVPAIEAATRRSIALIHKDLGDLDIAEEEMTQAVALAESAGLSTLAQDQQALEEIQALRAQQTPSSPAFRNQ